MTDKIELVIITGMSGAGKTVAIQSFEDLGYYCIDNMPPSLLPIFWKLMKETTTMNRIVLVIDLRTREFFKEVQTMINELENTPAITTRILFLDASDETLVSRYKETRRKHPLATDRTTLDGIRTEREMLKDLKSRAQLRIDTSHTTPRQLRQKIMDEFRSSQDQTFRVEVMSFGFKYGIPIDADIVMDVRFLPNPHYIDELRPLTGMDAPVYDYMMKQPETEKFYGHFMNLLRFCLPGYKKEGKSSVTIAIGCTGGKHRSVSLARRVAKELENEQYEVNITHRDARR